MWGSIGVFLVGIALFPWALEAFSTPKLFLIRIFTLVGLGACVLAWVRARSISIQVRWTPAFALAFLLFLTAQVCFFRGPWFSLAKTAEYTTWFLFLLYLSWGHSRGCPGDVPREALPAGYRNISFVIVELLTVPVVAYAFIQHFGWDPIRWNPGGRRVFAFMQNADAFAASLAVLTAFILIRYLARPRFLRLVLLGCALAALFWSGTRGPVLSLLSAGLVLTVFIAFNASLRPWRSRMAVLWCGGILLSSMFFFMSRHNAEAQRFSPATWKSDRNVIARGYFFKKGIELVALHPWTGVGPGNFTFAYLPLRYNDPPFYRNRVGIGESTHNAFLDVAVETGLIGGILFLSIWLAAFLELGTALKNPNLEILSLFFPLVVAFLALQFTYPDPALEAITGYFLGISPLVLPDRAKTFRMSLAFSKFFLIAVFIFLSMGTVITFRIAIADVYAGRGDFSSALIWNPREPAYAERLGMSYEQAGNALMALFYYNRAVAINPTNPFYWGDIGRLAAENGWKRRALTAYAKALALDPYNPTWAHDGALAARRLRARE